MIIPYRIIPIDNLIRKCAIDESGYIADKTFVLYDSNMVDNIMDFTFLNIFFITPRFKYVVGYELINIKNMLVSTFGSDVVIYECSDSEMESIKKNTLQKLTFESLIISLNNLPSNPTADNIIHSIDDLNDERKIINTIVYFLYFYHRIESYDPIKTFEPSYNIIENNNPIINNFLYSDITSIIRKTKFNTTVDVSNIVEYIENNNIIKRYIIDYLIDDNGYLRIILPENTIFIGQDTFYVT